MIYILNKILLKFTFILLLLNVSYSNSCFENVSIQKNFFNEEIIGYYLSAIDLESGESNVLLFDYSIDFSDAINDFNCNSNPCPTEFGCDLWYEELNIFPNQEHGITELYFDFEISMYVPSIDGFDDGPTTLVDGTVRLDNIPKDLSSLSFRNTDLNFDTQYLQGGTTFGLPNHNIYIDDSVIDNLTELLLSYGRLPNGIYYFNFNLKESLNADSFTSISEEIEVFVPSYLDLIAPGSSGVSDTLSNIIMTTNPIFQWNSDYCNNCELAIRVAEYRPQDHSSLSEAIEDYSILPVESGFHYIDANSNTFQYPFSNVGNLINGKIYVWQLLRTFVTTSGISEEFSDIYVFKIQSLESEIETSISNNENFENIRLLIGDQKYNELFGVDGQLSEFIQMNNIITVNGQSMSVNYLIELINQLNDGQINVIEVEIE